MDFCGKGSHLLLLLPSAGPAELRSLPCLSSLLFSPLGKQATFRPVSGTMHPAMDGLQADTSRLLLRVTITSVEGITGVTKNKPG